jgi:hypothetical protein
MRLGRNPGPGRQLCPDSIAGAAHASMLTRRPTLD